MSLVFASMAFIKQYCLMLMNGVISKRLMASSVGHTSKICYRKDTASNNKSGWLCSLKLRDLPLDNYCEIQICVIKIDTAKEVNNGIPRIRRKVRV